VELLDWPAGEDGDEKKIKNQNAKIKNVEPLRGSYF